MKTAEAPTAHTVERARAEAMDVVLGHEDPIARLEALAALLDEWRQAEDTLLDTRRSMVIEYERFLSYRELADALGCSKANIHQILHPVEKAG